MKKMAENNVRPTSKTADIQAQAEEQAREQLGVDSPPEQDGDLEARDKEARQRAAKVTAAQAELKDPNSEIRREIDEKVAQEPAAKQRYLQGQLEREYVRQQAGEDDGGSTKKAKASSGGGGQGDKS